MKMPNFSVLSLMALALGLAFGWPLAGCRRASEVSEESSMVLRLGVLPDLDSLPVALALERGWFEEAGLRVELVRAASAVERDQLLQAGRIDGLVTDPLALALYNRHRIEVLAVRRSLVPGAGRPQFRLLASPVSGLLTGADLAGVPVAVSTGTVIEYAGVQTLTRCGLAAAQIKFVAVPGIGARLAMLRVGKVKAAVLPEPLASLAVLEGAVPLADAIDQKPFLYSIWAFRQASCKANPAAVAAFLGVVDRACREINRQPEAARAFAVTAGLLPQPLASSFPMLVYPAGGLPERDVYEQAVAWLRESGQLAQPPDFDQVVWSGVPH